MELINAIIKLIIICGIFNVWLIRFNNPTPYRGSKAKTLHEEFKIYGYPTWFFYIIGCLKISFALCLAAGFWHQQFVTVGALGLSLLMAGAIISHIKVNDTLQKYIPASIMLLMSLFVLISSLTVQNLL